MYDKEHLCIYKVSSEHCGMRNISVPNWGMRTLVVCMSIGKVLCTLHQPVVLIFVPLALVISYCRNGFDGDGNVSVSLKIIKR